VLSRLSPDEGGAGGGARLGDATHDVRDALWHHLPAGDVIGHEEGGGPGDHEVVDHHRHEVLPDRVVDPHGLGDADLGADPVGGGGEDGALHGEEGGGVVHAREAAGAGQDRRCVGGRHRGLHEFDGVVPGCGVHPGGGVVEAHGVSRSASGRVVWWSGAARGMGAG